jgi:hypothetical protein
MNVQPSLITNSQPTEAVEPGERALAPSWLCQFISLIPTCAFPASDCSLLLAWQSSVCVGMMPRLRRASLLALESYPLSACSLTGRLRGRPLPFAPLLTGGMASTISSSIVVSATLAPVSFRARGIPRRQTTGAARRWRFVPKDEGRSCPYPSGSILCLAPLFYPSGSHRL